MAENMRLAMGESSPVKTSRSPTNSITHRASFRVEIERVRRHGYAVMDEENENGMRAAGMPLLNSQGCRMQRQNWPRACRSGRQLFDCSYGEQACEK